MAADLDWKSGVVIATLVTGIVVMAFDAVPPDLIFAGMVSLLTACRIITIQQATAGFASSGLLTVVALYVVAEGISQTGGMERALNVVLGRTKSPFWAQLRMFVPVMLTSAVLNNTPIVALLIPIMIAWGRRAGVSPKKLLIPLAYAAVFGGTLTLIGTSTNLVISSLQEKRYAKTSPEDARFNFFDITPYGVPYALFGMCYSLIFSTWLLVGGETRRHSDLLFIAKIPASSKAVGRSIANAGLQYMERVLLTAVERDGLPHYRVSTDFVLQTGDVLYLTGDYKQAQLFAKAVGFELLDSETEMLAGVGGDADDEVVLKKLAPKANEQTKRLLLQATLRPKSELAGSAIQSLNFRFRFNAAVLAVKRAGKHQAGKIGEIVLDAGDILILLTENTDLAKSKDFKQNFKQVDVLDQTLEKEFLTGARVTKRFSGIGKSITASGLRGVEGLYLVGIDRITGEELRVIAPDTLIEEGDILWFCGNVSNMLFVTKIPGLESLQVGQITRIKADILYRVVVQVSVACHSPLIGHTVRDVKFRDTYDAVVIAVHRADSRVPTDVRDIRFEAGDVVLLDTGEDFAGKYAHDKAFSVIAGIKDSSPLKTRRMWVALALGAAMITTQIVGGALNEDLINLFTAATITGGLMLASRCMNVSQARSSIDWTVYICIAFAFGMSTALEVTDVAQGIADIFTTVSERIGGRSASFVAIYVATALLSEIVSNNAAAALMYPIAARLGDNLGVSPTQMSAVVMIGASAGFAFPWSYQVNLMVYAAGNYRFTEFLVFGVPCQLWLVAAVIIIFVLHQRIWIPIALASGLTVCTIGLPITWALLPATLKARARGAVSLRRRKAAAELLEPIKPIETTPSGVVAV